MPGPPLLDVDQRAVLALPDGASAVVLGAPGTGRTTAAVALVADRIRSGRLAPEQVLLLAPRRAQASRLRDRLLLEVGRPVSAPLARTAASLAFDVARRDAAADGRDTPVLLSGGEQDRLIAQLLPGSEAEWPEHLGPEVRETRAFRGELRELFARCTERDVDPVELADLAARSGRQEWRAAAEFWREYLEVLPAAEPDAFDSAELVALATAAVLRGRAGALAGDLRLLVVDDMQDLGESAVGLLAALADRGCAVIAFGDPDVAADTFRGGEPDLLGRFEQRLGIEAPARIVLRTVHRHPETVRRFVAKVTERIGTALAGPQRAAAARPGGAPVLSVEADGPGALAARIAHILRDRHLEHDVPFAEQAVVVRSGALVEPLARALEIAGVPAVTSGTAQDAGDRAARALVEVVAVALGLIPLTPESAVALATGPFCGLDRLALRRLRLALRVEELGGGGARTAGELLVDALAAPDRLTTIDAPFVRRAARLAEVLQQVRDLDASGASAEDLLWHVWDASGLAPAWRERALGAGLVSAEANRDLDDVVALFASAARAAERGPTDPAAVFLTARLEADVADDSLAPRGRRDGVLVTTPVGVAGREFDTVVIAGLQDGVWPNLRPRGSLLGLGELVAQLDDRGAPTSPTDERRAVLSDELRLFALAASRARSVLLLAAVANDDEAPSVLFGLADGPAPDAAATAPNALRPLVGLLRRTLVGADSDEVRVDAAAALARLARADVAGAAPATWWGLAGISTDRPLVPDPEQPVRVSPSKLDRFEESPLDWFLERVAGGEPMLAGAIGTMLHRVLETATEPDEAALLAALEGRWRELDFEADWVEAREHRLADRMIGSIARYLADVAREGTVLLGGETSFEFPVGRALATGTIDRVERDAAGRVRVVDLKTGSTRPTGPKLATHAQLGVYQLAVQAGAVEGIDAAANGGAALLFVRQKGKEPYALLAQPALDDEAAEAFRTRLAAAADGMAAGEFPGPVEPEVRFGSSSFRPMLLRVPEVCGG